MRRSPTWRWNLVVIVCLVVFTVWTLAPIAWTIISSFLTNSSLTASPPNLTALTLDNYRAVLDSDTGFLQAGLHSLVVAFATAAIALIFGSAAAYALARLNVPGSNRILLMVLATQMFPGIVIVIPVFLVLSEMHLTDTYFGLIIVELSIVLPIAVWVLKGFFDAVPPQLERAAAVDGAGVLQMFRSIVLPMSLPPLFATGIFCFIETWNEFFFAMLLTGRNTRTVPVAISQFAGGHQVLFGQTVASAVLASIPVVLLAIIFRKNIIKGFVEGAVKG
ncbi:MAG: carbohydrate ABC transporter permease [Actinomycetia bacterium]|nr:carbohydrate ABC transporter permease [Actinomycetes bacterium]